FQSELSNALTPVLMLLNFCTIFASLALLGGVMLVAALFPAWLFLMVFLGGLLLAWSCYNLSVRGALGYGSLIRVAYDLYRDLVLEKMEVPAPDSLLADRRLWLSLTEFVRQGTMPWIAEEGLGTPPASTDANFPLHKKPDKPDIPNEEITE